MKITEKSKQEKVNLGDIVKGGSGYHYLVIRSFETGKFTMVNLNNSISIRDDFFSIESMIEDFFSEYTVVKKENIELVLS